MYSMSKIQEVRGSFQDSEWSILLHMYYWTLLTGHSTLRRRIHVTVLQKRRQDAHPLGNGYTIPKIILNSPLVLCYVSSD